MSNQKKTWSDAKERWRALGIKAAIAIPDLFLADHSEDEKVSNRKGLHRVVIRVLTALVVTLAFASIGNMVSRALLHHNGFNAYAGGIALAALVPISVFITAAIFRNDAKRRMLGWAISAVFATVSATIQFYAYSAGDNFSLEAFAFGAGIPVAECLLAVLAAAVESQIEEEEEVELASSIEADFMAQQDAEEAIKKERREREAEEDRRRAIKAEDERRRAELALEIEQRAKDAEAKRENERIKAAAAADAKRIKAQSASVKNSVKSDATYGVKSNTPTSGNRAENRRVRLVEILHSFDSPSDINKTKIAKQLGVSRQTIISDINALESSGLISLNGSVKIHTNGAIK